ncbi:MAG: hypothetical protein QNJ61_13640 [Desulfobacterales bacterium]|nr:hypothetical protein [Desulfobacterales bacterium]MDJ0856070.1 hypothetical protein [Desulfobacterales bacterium]
MSKTRSPTTGLRTVTFCIWTLCHQTQIAGHIRVFTWAGTLLILLLALSGRISLDAALHGIVISLLSIALLLWMLIGARKKSLLNIRDPELREAAHIAMMLHIHGRRLTAWEKARLRKKFGRRYCGLGHC